MSRVKKILALLMAVVMTLGMTVTAFAAKAGATINVTGLSTNGTQSVTIYEIFRLDENDNGWVKAEWVPKTVTIDNLTSEESLQALKEAAGTTTGVTKTTTNGSVSFTENIQVGAYLVLALDESGKVTYNTMVAETCKYDTNGLIAADVANVVAKAENYTTDKKQNPDDAEDDAVVEVGDLVKFQITTTVPYNDGSLETFTVTDTLTGASYYLSGDPVKGVDPVSTITVDGAPSSIAIPSDANGKKTFTVDLSSLIDKSNANAGKTIVITYTAKVEAVDTVTNKATSTNDPKGTTTTTYTGQAQITKLGEGSTKLVGAEFALYRVKDESTREYAVIDNNGYITGDWVTVKKSNEKFEVPEDIDTVTTNDQGIAVVKGLDVGTYYFDEIIAPDGYSINTNDSQVNVSKTEPEGKVVVYGSTEMTDTKLSSLPSTGGIGTTIFTIGGCAIMIVAAGLYFATRKKTEK